MMKYILGATAILLWISGLACLAVELIQDRRGIKRLGFISYIKQKQTIWGKLFPVFMGLSAFLLLIAH